MNGVGKTDAEAEAALRAGVLVNAESLEELDALLAFGIPGPRIGLRLNPGIDVATHPHLATGAATSKFGIPIAALLDAASTGSRARESRRRAWVRTSDPTSRRGRCTTSSPDG